MHSEFNRRTATKVKAGRVQKKNHHRPTGHDGYVLDREGPGRGFQHVVSKKDLQTFIDLIPDWDQLSIRLERIVLGRACSDDGSYVFYHREETGAIYLHAWPQDLWMEIETSYFNSHQKVFDRIGVSHDRHEDYVFCRFTASQARAFVLLHVFLHELGHHFDRTNQKHLGATKGEDYAEAFANRRFDELFGPYVQAFGDPARSND